MEVRVKMPRVGENVSEILIVELVAERDQMINVGDVLAKVETDKAAVDVVAPIAGRFVEYLVVVDQELVPGDEYAVIEVP